MRSVRSTTTAVLLAVLASGALPAQEGRPAQGLAFWIQTTNTTLQDLVATATGAPRFAIGFNRERLRYGIGVGIVRFEVSDRDAFGPGSSSEDETSATLFQVGPAFILDVWRSPDLRTRGNVGLGLAIGRLSATDRTTFTDPQAGTQVTESKTTGTLIGFHGALGTDHFLSPHFALGAEAGIQGTFGLDIKEEGAADGGFGINAAGTYVALRVTVVF